MPSTTAIIQRQAKLRPKRDGLFTRVAFPAGVTLFVIISLFPLYWMLVQALQPESKRYTQSILPQDPSLNGFISAFQNHDVLLWVGNTTLVAGASALLVLAVGAWGAYAISRFQTRGTAVASFLILATQMIPPVVLMVPIYKAFIAWGLIGGLESLVVANFVFTLPVAVWMLKSVFDSVPVEMEEAARVDGCNRFTVLWRITLPLSLPGALATGIFAFIESWQEYLLARVLIADPSNWVGSIGIASFFGEHGTPWDQVMATSLIFSIPPIILFLVVQQRFVEGMSGGLKG